MDIDRQLELARTYDIIMDLLEDARKDYEEAVEEHKHAAERVTALTDVANTLRNMLDV